MLSDFNLDSWGFWDGISRWGARCSWVFSTGLGGISLYFWVWTVTVIFIDLVLVTRNCWLRNLGSIGSVSLRATHINIGISSFFEIWEVRGIIAFVCVSSHRSLVRWTRDGGISWRWWLDLSKRIWRRNLSCISSICFRTAHIDFGISCLFKVRQVWSIITTVSSCSDRCLMRWAWNVRTRGLSCSLSWRILWGTHLSKSPSGCSICLDSIATWWNCWLEDIVVDHFDSGLRSFVRAAAIVVFMLAASTGYSICHWHIRFSLCKLDQIHWGCTISSCLIICSRYIFRSLNRNSIPSHLRDTWVISIIT